MERRHSAVCILGGGPTALISHALLRKRGIEADIIAGMVLGNLASMLINGLRVSPIPIFVSPESNLFRQIEWGPVIDDDYVTTFHSPTSTNDMTDKHFPGAYAEFMVQRYPDAEKRLIITKKHVGSIVFRQDLPGLRRKVLSHYPPGVTAHRRVGFRDGVSPYLHYLEREQFPMPIKGVVRAIDVVNRCVMTDTCRMTYDRLISTLPLLRFLALAGIATSLEAIGGGAQIVVSSTPQATRRNHLVYDCDAASPVHRVFVPREGFVIAQVAHPHWDINATAITGRVQELFDFADRPIFLKRLTVQNCYPLALSDYALRDTIMDELECSGVTLFGRLAQWEYLDLEELNWDRITCNV